MKKRFTEEELEFDGSDDDELLHTDKNDAVKMEKEKKKKKKKRKMDNKDESNDVQSSDDDGLPEVFSMKEGRSMAQQQKSEEKASGKMIAEVVKKKKQERTTKRKEEKKKSRKLEKPLSSMEPTIENTVMPSKVTGLLDETIVQFLSERERTKLDFTNVHSSSPMDVNLKKASKPKRKEKNSRVQVMVLNAELGRFADHSALQFKKEHLYGNRIRRDTCMLKAR